MPVWYRRRSGATEATFGSDASADSSDAVAAESSERDNAITSAPDPMRRTWRTVRPGSDAAMPERTTAARAASSAAVVLERCSVPVR